MIDPVRPITIGDVEQARERIAGTVLRTPLVKLDLGSGAPQIWLKLENVQPTNAYKIRGAANAVAKLSDAERAKGVWTISAGPPTSRACRSIAPKSIPPDPVVATAVPSIALGISTAPSPATQRSRS